MGKRNPLSQFRWTCSPTANPFWLLESPTYIASNQLALSTVLTGLEGPATVLTVKGADAVLSAGAPDASASL